MLKTAVQTKTAFSGLKTAPFSILKQLKPLQTSNTQNHQKDQNLINFKETFFYSKKKRKVS
jgi:tRNA A37 threonylcarbamoyltransferase TsaD